MKLSAIDAGGFASWSAFWLINQMWMHLETDLKVIWAVIFYWVGEQDPSFCLVSCRKTPTQGKSVQQTPIFPAFEKWSPWWEWIGYSFDEMWCKQPLFGMGGRGWWRRNESSWRYRYEKWDLKITSEITTVISGYFRAASGTGFIDNQLMKLHFMRFL